MFKTTIKLTLLFLVAAITLTGCFYYGLMGDRKMRPSYFMIFSNCEQRVKLTFKYTCEMPPASELEPGCFTPVKYVFQDGKDEFQAELRPVNSPLGFFLDGYGVERRGKKYPTNIVVEFDRLTTLGEIPKDLIMEITYFDGRVETVSRNQLFCIGPKGSKKMKYRGSVLEPCDESMSLVGDEYEHYVLICPGDEIRCNLK